MKAFITKYALTKGIIEVDDAEVYPNGIIEARSVSKYILFSRGEWRATRADAERHASEMREAKLASLRKQIERLEVLRFEKEEA